MSKYTFLEAGADDTTGEKGNMEPKRKYSTLNPSLQPAGMGVKAPKQPCLSGREIRPITVGGCWHANTRGVELRDGIFFLEAIAGVESDKPT